MKQLKDHKERDQELAEVRTVAHCYSILSYPCMVSRFI